jgi:hypothetical protein
MPTRVLAAVVAVGLTVGGGAFYFVTRADDTTSVPDLGSPEDRTFASNDPIERACALPQEQLVRLWRGHHPVHSEDVTTVPLDPNYSGGFTVTSHSGPWDYVQTIPLVLYGDQIPAAGPVERPASITDASRAGTRPTFDNHGRLGRRRAERAGSMGGQVAQPRAA